MAENKEYITQQENTGSILISEDVVASIATAATLETEGVSAMLSAAGGDLKPSRKMSAKGVVIEPEDDGLRIVNCNIPCGATAVAVLEQAELCQVTDGEKRLGDSAGVVRAWQSEDDVMLELESGSYAFKWRND